MKLKRFSQEFLKKNKYKKNNSLNLGKKFISLLICFILIFNPILVTSIYAEDVILTPEQITESTVTPADNTLNTGDASSIIETQTQVNINQTEIPRTISSPPGIIVQNNTADVTTSGSSDATTGSNESITDNGDIDLSTGDATASGIICNEINENVTLLVTPESTPSGFPEDIQILTEESEPKLEIINNNDGTLNNNLTVNADTGLNLVQGSSGNINLDTGNALSLGNIFNALNLNFLGSDFEILVLNASGSNNVNLNQSWKDLLAGGNDNTLQLASSSDTDTISLAINNNNLANLQNTVFINANTGQNIGLEDQGNVGLSTGNATAVGNVINLVNGNIVGSKILFVIINILDNFEGNLIVPRPQNFENSNTGVVQPVIFSNNNVAQIDNLVNTLAQTGDNEATASGNSTMETGTAKAVSNSTILTNLNLQSNNQFSLLINNLGTWVGSIYGWSNPESQEVASDETLTLDTQGGNPDGTSHIEVVNENSAILKTDLIVSANTGLNEVSTHGNSNLKTGNALAIANLFDLINFNIFGSNLFMGIVNNLGTWSGNYISAFPDTTILITGPTGEVTPSSNVTYTINYQNQGQDPAPGTVIKFNLPKGTSYISDNSGLFLTQSENELIWNIGDLKEGYSDNFIVNLRIDANLKPDDLLTFWDKVMDKLVTTVNAAEDGKRGSLVVNVSISTSDSQSNSKNDSSSTITTILFPNSNSNSNSTSSESLEETKILVTAKNNVNKFVYPGDIITYEITAKNIGSVVAKNVTISQRMYDGKPQDMGTIDFPVGNMNPGQIIHITFGLALNKDTAEDIYYTETYAVGENVSSGIANTQFEVKTNSISLIPIAYAVENTDNLGNNQIPEVLGEQTCPVVQPRKEWLPWVLVTAFSTLWFVEFSRRKGWIENSRRKFKLK